MNSCSTSNNYTREEWNQIHDDLFRECRFSECGPCGLCCDFSKGGSKPAMLPGEAGHLETPFCPCDGEAWHGGPYRVLCMIFPFRVRREGDEVVVYRCVDEDLGYAKQCPIKTDDLAARAMRLKQTFILLAKSDLCDLSDDHAEKGEELVRFAISDTAS